MRGMKRMLEKENGIEVEQILRSYTEEKEDDKITKPIKQPRSNGLGRVVLR